MTEHFDADWLSLREGFDARARSVALAARLAAVLPARPRLVDLGAGTGSLFRWLAPLLGRPQRWVLADADAGLLARGLDEIAAWAVGRGLFVEDRGRSLVLHGPDGAWEVVPEVVDLAGALPVRGQDAVLCSALLDLVSEAWVERLAEAVRVPVLACLSVDGRDAWRPLAVGDAAVRAGFRRDQARDKGFGRALGAGATSAFRRVFEARGFAVESTVSDWVIPRGATRMLAELVAGHAGAALRQRPGKAGAIGAWRRARLAQIGRGRLAIRIGHRDSLALPPR